MPAGEQSCGMQCPRCHAQDACFLSWSHFGDSKHRCSYCKHSWD